MIFNTSWFLLFFCVFYPVFLLVPGGAARFFFVLLASAVFHYNFAGPAGVLPILVMAAATYLCGIGLSRAPAGTARRRALFRAGLAVPVLGLIAYKYSPLILTLLASVPGNPAADWLLGHADASPLPLAISFFAFEFVHYLTDVYHGAGAITQPFRFALFSIYFPSIVSGPIKRFQPFLSQLAAGFPRPSLEDALTGAARVLLGFFKKLVVADNAAVLIGILEQDTSPSRRAVVVLMALLSIRILFDFSGYSDIAIGLSRMLGVSLPENFRYPYAARNIAAFWQRWHMSLSSWIRDYIYIPLGGSRVAAPRWFFNLAVTMFLCGLWHGAAWHFGVWGLYHGLGLAVHAAYERTPWGRRLAGAGPNRLLDAVRIAVTNVFVAYGWLLFFYPLDTVLRFTRRLLFPGGAP